MKTARLQDVLQHEVRMRQLKEVVKDSPVDAFYRKQRENLQNKTFDDNYTNKIMKPTYNVNKIDLAKLKE